MAKWGFKGSKDATSVKTVSAVITVTGAARAKVYDMAFGCSASPADNAFLWQVQRSTTTGTATAAVANALDPADTTAATVIGYNVFTVDPTLTAGAFLYQVPLNQRATFRWVAAPGSELVIPATANAGIALIVSSATTTVLDSGVMYEQQ